MKTSTADWKRRLARHEIEGVLPMGAQELLELPLIRVKIPLSKAPILREDRQHPRCDHPSGRHAWVIFINCVGEIPVGEGVVKIGTVGDPERLINIGEPVNADDMRGDDQCQQDQQAEPQGQFMAGHLYRVSDTHPV